MHGGGIESIPVQVQHTSEHQGRMQHFCLSSQQLIVIKKKEKHYAEFIPEVPMTTAGLLIVFIVRILLLQYFWSQGKTVPSLLKTLASFCDALIRLLSYEQGYSQVSHIVFQMQLCEACNELPLREKQKRITV